MVDFLITVGGIAGLFNVIERLITEEHLRVLSQFIFGNNRVRFSAFRNNASQAAIGAFVENGKVSLSRTALYSLLSIFLILISAMLWTEPFVDSPAEAGKFYEQTGLEPPVLTSAGYVALLVYQMLLPALAAIILHIPFDYISLSISKRFFYNTAPTSLQHVGLILLDLFLSILLPLLIFIGVMVVQGNIQLIPDEEGLLVRAYILPSHPLVYMALFASILAVFSSSLFSIIQVSIIIFGVALNAISRLLLVPKYIGDISTAKRHPLTALGLFLGLIIAALSVLIRHA